MKTFTPNLELFSTTRNPPSRFAAHYNFPPGDATGLRFAITPTMGEWELVKMHLQQNDR